METFYWIDSITALYWIKNVKKWKQYVEHRVREIRQLSDKEQWRFCPGLQNPADLPSCGLNGEQLATNIVWWNGSEFLTFTALSRSQHVLGHLANNRVTWTFIVERAPWWGGFWERLIKLIKRCLKKIVGRSMLTFEELNINPRQCTKHSKYLNLYLC